MVGFERFQVFQDPSLVLMGNMAHVCLESAFILTAGHRHISVTVWHFTDFRPNGWERWERGESWEQCKHWERWEGSSDGLRGLRRPEESQILEIKSDPYF